MGAVGAHDAGVESHIPTNIHKVQKNGIKSQGQRGWPFAISESEGRWEGWRDGGKGVILSWNVLWFARS